VKKTIIFCAFILAANTAFADHQSSAPTTQPANAATATADDPETTANDNDTIFISDTVKLVPKMAHEENADQHYEIDYSYPELEDGSLTAKEQEFNKKMSELALAEVNQFKKYVAEDAAHMATLPESVRHNYLNIDYDADVIKPANSTLISVRLTSEGMQAGRAHPYHLHKVLNYDLSSGKVLQLNELFKPHSPFLKIIANYCKNALTKKLQDKWMIDGGTKPKPENYKNWNLEQDNLLITFDEYQVAPYVYGAQEIHIPYSVLKNVIAPSSPIYACLQGKCGTKSD